MDNSPHVPFFKPIIEELKKSGFEILITTRKCFQVCELADYYNIPYIPIGKHYGKNKIIKLLGLFYRSMQLLPIIIKEKPSLSLSHGSRSQLITSKILNIPCVVIFDYEYVQAIPFLSPSWAIAPEVVVNSKNHLWKNHILSYPGIKENIYVPYFRPDPNILRTLGFQEGNILITIRPPATEAHYHNPESEKLFEATIKFLAPISNTQLVILSRNEKQGNYIKKRWPFWGTNGKIIFPNQVVNGLNLIWYSDLVISGGGTMNREAAALGVPVYSIFLGKIGAIDQYLASIGTLVLLRNVEDVRTKIKLVRRNKSYNAKNNGIESLQKLVERIIWIYSRSYSK